MTEMIARSPLSGLGLKTRDGATRPLLVRVLVVVLMALLIVPMVFSITPASAAKDDEEADNYSLYQLASNASSYFAQENSPVGKGDLAKNWGEVTDSAADGGSMLGYADPDFSLGDAVGWAFNEVSGSSQSVRYETFVTPAEANSDANYSGMLDYAHFGAANNSLGLDSMSSGIGGSMLAMISGSIVWILYALALAISTTFWVVIQLLKLLNPFGWFYTGIMSAGDGSADSIDAQKEMALGMMDGAPQSSQSILGHIQIWVGSWYGLLNDMAWQLMVPLFVAVLIFSLVVLKKSNRGSLLKKLVIRLLFIGLGLPLIGSLYTSVLNQFDDSMFGQHSGPTRVVLSTYVDFEDWAMNQRLAIPENADISWSGQEAGASSMMNARTTALAINAASNSEFSQIQVGESGTSADEAWNAGTGDFSGAVAEDDATQGSDAGSILAVLGLLNNYISGTEVSAADFESGVKSEITRTDTVKDKDKQAWFDDSGSYGDVKDLGKKGDPVKPNEHPVISVAPGEGLQAELVEADDGSSSVYEFTTSDAARRSCHFQVVDEDGNAAACNLAPLAMYNYLNTGFGPDAMTMYSSNNATSGFTRENHMAVSQVGTGPVKVTFWSNTVVILGVIVLLGFSYAFGMLFGAIKRVIGLVGAIPLATLGSLGQIAKLVIYATVLILEVLVTLFLYQFVSEIILVLPSLITGPMSSFLGNGSLLGSRILGTVAIVVLTLLSTLFILVIAFALMRARKVVLTVIDEQVTKYVNRFMETEAAPTGAGQLGGGTGDRKSVV